jgi:hypothetical protein
MTKEELNYKITGTETPTFVSERENKIIDICLEIINELEIDKIQIGVHVKNISKLSLSPQVQTTLEKIMLLTK